MKFKSLFTSAVLAAVLFGGDVHAQALGGAGAGIGTGVGSGYGAGYGVQRLRVNNLVNRSIYTPWGTTLAVNEVVLGPNRTPYAVVGYNNQNLLLPFNNFGFRNGQLMLTGLSRAGLGGLQTYTAGMDGYTALGASRRIGVASLGAGVGTGLGGYGAGAGVGGIGATGAVGGVGAGYGGYGAGLGAGYGAGVGTGLGAGYGAGAASMLSPATIRQIKQALNNLGYNAGPINAL